MAQEKKAKAPIYTTPIGVLGKFPKLVEPDDYLGKRSYKAELILPADEAQAIIARIEEALPLAEQEAKEQIARAAAEARRKGKKVEAFEPEMKVPYYEIVDPDTGEETGDIAFKFSSNAVFKDRKTGAEKERRLNFFTASGKPIKHEDKPDLWGGSRVRIAYSLFAYYNASAKNYGVSLRLEAVQVIEVRGKGEGGDASRYGFGKEDGYEGEDGEDKGTPFDAEDEDQGGDEPPPRF